MNVPVLDARGAQITVALPSGIDTRAACGRFFLARSAPGDALTRPWAPYLRRPLYPIRIEPRGPVVRWTLSTLAAETAPLPPLPTPLDLIGPCGRGLELPPQARALLLAADAARAPRLFPLVDSLLDRGGRVLLLLLGQPSAAENAALVQQMPLAAEVRVEEEAALAPALASLARWADQIVLALPPRFTSYAPLAHALRAARFRLDPGFAHALVETPLPCGSGACLACLTPLAGGGFTRTCVHGPVFDLTRLA